MNTELYNSLPEDLQDIYTKYCLPDKLDGLTLESVILSDENRRKINDFVTETRFKDRFVHYGLEPVNRILNYGASGTGKTFLTKCMAAEFGYELLAIDIAQALSTGTAAVALENIFKLGNHIGKAIIFLDECDAIARDRTSNKLNEDANVRRANNALFQLLDRMNPSCIFVSCTNLYTELDVAFVRRFNLKLRFDRPALEDLESAINKFLLKDFTIENDMDEQVKEVILYHARNYTGLSYDEIETWVERAEKLAIMRDSTIIKETDIYNFFMDSLRVKVSYNEKTGKPYLYQV